MPVTVVMDAAPKPPGPGRKGWHVKGAKLPEWAGQGKPRRCCRWGLHGSVGALAFMLTMTSAHTRNGVDGVESAPHFLTAS